jgi:hypothetical protein
MQRRYDIFIHGQGYASEGTTSAKLAFQPEPPVQLSSRMAAMAMKKKSKKKKAAKKKSS